MSRFRMAWLADKLTMLRRTDAAKLKATKPLASTASSTLNPLVAGNSAELRKLSNPHSSKILPRVEHALDQCLQAIA